MSWAAHNPEKYEEIEREGVTAKLRSALKENGFDEYDADTLTAIVDTLQVCASGATIYNPWSQLTCWACQEISNAEGDYFGGLADAALDAYRDRQLRG